MRLLSLISALIITVHLHAQDLPATQVTDIHSGKKLAFSEVPDKGKLTLITFWATWCVPGKQEVKTILPHVQHWKKQLDFDYKIIAVDQQNNEHLVQAYVKEQGWNIPCYINANSELKHALGFQSLPQVIIVDRAGKIAFSHNGYMTSEAILAKLKEIAGSNTK